MFISENIFQIAIKLEYFEIQCSDLCNVWKSVIMSSYEELILVISTANGPNITYQKAKKRSKVLQVHFIAMEWGFFTFERLYVVPSETVPCRNNVQGANKQVIFAQGMVFTQLHINRNKHAILCFVKKSRFSL